ncbi:MAG: hypothetical protein V7739_20135 [Motiliproteus sp.]
MLIKRFVFICTLLSCTLFWGAYLFQFSSIWISDQLASTVLWWERSPERFSEVIEQSIEQGRIDEAHQLIELNREAGYPHDREWDEAIGERSSLSVRIIKGAKDGVHGALTGDVSNSAELGGAVASDLTLFGDVRDLAIEGTRYATGNEPDLLIVGLATTGLLTTALPAADVGVSIAKAAIRRGHGMSAFRSFISNEADKFIDWAALNQLFRKADFSIVGFKNFHAEAKRHVNTQRVSHVFKDIGGIHEQTGSAAQTLTLIKYVDDKESLTAAKHLSQRYGERSSSLVRLTNGRLINAFLQGIQQAIWLFFSLLMTLITVLQTSFKFLITPRKWMAASRVSETRT